MHPTSYYIINAITVYRILASLLLFYCIYTGQQALFKWLLAVSFFTDAIDGFLSRKFKVASVIGAKFDSIGDDLTVLVGCIGIYWWQPDFIKKESAWLIVLFALFIIQLVYAVIRYRKFTSFHTLLAKCSAIFQGVFLILFFFLPEPPTTLFRIAAIVTMAELLEEIILIGMLPKWEVNVKGIYWVLKRNKRGAIKG